MLKDPYRAGLSSFSRKLLVDVVSCSIWSSPSLFGMLLRGEVIKRHNVFAANRVVLGGRLFPLLSPDYVFFTQRIVPFDNPTIALLGEGVPK